MLYVIDKGFVEGYGGGQSEVVHLVSSAEHVEAAGLDWVFTDGHADMPPLTSFYDDFEDLNKVDWPLMNSKYWHDTDDHPDRARRRQAEFLVHTFFPWELVASIGVQTEATAENIREIIADVVHRPQITIQKGWYY
jgi:hypothetical protein